MRHDQKRVSEREEEWKGIEFWKEEQEENKIVSSTARPGMKWMWERKSIKIIMMFAVWRVELSCSTTEKA